MLVIRFLRVGKRNQPAFKIVVIKKGKPPKSGRFVEQVGFYNPLTKEKVLNQERIKYWIEVGAKPSPSLFNLLLKENVLEGEKIPVHKKSKLKKKKEKEVSAAEGEKPPDKEKEQPEEKPKEEKPVPEEKETKRQEETKQLDKS